MQTEFCKTAKNYQYSSSISSCVLKGLLDRKDADHLRIEREISVRDLHYTVNLLKERNTDVYNFTKDKTDAINEKIHNIRKEENF